MHMASPVFSFGLVTDVQHADKDTVAFDGRPQRYRESAGKLEAALAALGAVRNTCTAEGPEQCLSFVLTLGDIVDGYSSCKDSASAAANTSRDLQEVAQLFKEAVQVPVCHALGNHCLAAQRTELIKVLQMPASYYSVQLASNWQLTVLDTTDMSLHSGYPEDSPQVQQARQWLATHPKERYPNAELWHGGLSEAQMVWLQGELAAAARAGRQVIIACHHPVAPGSAPDEYLAWNHETLLTLFEASNAVKLVLSGHYHPGGYTSRNGVHYVVFEGILEAPADSNAYGVVHVCPDQITICGYGVSKSRQLAIS